jgi:hypothetical protein
MLTNSKAITVICLLGIILSVVLSRLYFRFSYFEPDTVSYSFQAKLFARGKLSFEAPPEYGFSSSPHINILNGKWYSKYPFGNALMLTLGEFVNAHWLIPALVTGLALLLLYLIVLETYGKRVAILAASLGLISPATLGMGCTWFSEPVSRFYLAIYLLALIRALKGGHWFYPVISGFALGYAFNTRPIPAVAFGLAGACSAIYWIARSQESGLSSAGRAGVQRRIETKRIETRVAALKAMGLFLIPFALMMALCMAWNAYFTGNPLKFTHNAAQPYDRMGFGKRTESYDPDLENAFVFTPGYALERIWRHTIPCISFNTLGWGYYRPDLFRSYHDYTDSVVAGIVAKSPADKDWVTLKLWGHGDGTAQVQFQTRGNQSAPGLTGEVPGFSCSGGRADIAMRLVKQGDQYTGYFKTTRSDDWVQVGPTTMELTCPLEVGIYAGVAASSGNMYVDYGSFRINSDSSGELMSDDFTDPSQGLKQGWRWSREPRRWSLTESDLHVQADVNSNLFTDDSVAMLYQTTSADTFDVETRFAANWKNHERWLTLRVIPLAFPLVLMLIPIFHPSRNRYDVLFLAFLVFNLLFYFFFYFEGSTWGITPVNARYYTECTLLGIIPLVARGMFIFYGWMRRIPSKLPVVLFGLLLILLSINTVYTYVLIGKPYRNWGPVYQKLPRLVKQQDIHHAVIFIPRHRGAPIGDYPFQSLQDADIVYFKLGPSKVWRLTNSDWRSVYEQYFKGRNAYIYEDGRLTALDPGF